MPIPTGYALRPGSATENGERRRTGSRPSLDAVAIQFHLLSFEGPDPYARAGGIASRIGGLAQAIAAAGFETHLWFVGDPRLPAHERAAGVELHRWCQWISAHHPAGVYDGEEGKRRDYARSLPPQLCERHLFDHLRGGGLAVVMAEEWHTAEAVLHLDGLLRAAGVRDRVCILWNANNLFGFERIDWSGLRRAAAITTVSRYMKHRMWALGVDPIAIPNGVATDAFLRPDPWVSDGLQSQLAGRLLLAKMARFDPDKRWIAAIEIIADLKWRGLRPLLVARGGVEAHGLEVMSRAGALGLCVARRELAGPGARGLVEALSGLGHVDVVEVSSHVDPEARRLLFSAADAVLTNSGHEPFGLVGLEVMAVEGLACTGCTGEEYAIAGRNAIVLQTGDPAEFAALFLGLRSDPQRERAVRRAGRVTARQSTWPKILRHHLFPRLALLGGEPMERALGAWLYAHPSPETKAAPTVRVRTSGPLRGSHVSS